MHPTRAALYAFLAVVPAYIHARIRDHMLSGGWPDGPRASTWPAILASRHRRRTLWELVERLDLLRRALQLATLLRFLHNPRHPRALLDRILNISLRPLDAQPSRTVAFDFLHRQIVWQALTVSVPSPSLPLSLQQRL
uniref:Pex N-terminal domain-containing protein n=1 Tax=Puccinia triticina (isolate 1-1 / race 1 (BBBD)) TaxID=630390 RepID=A0ABL7CMS0_PUCT1